MSNKRTWNFQTAPNTRVKWIETGLWNQLRVNGFWARRVDGDMRLLLMENVVRLFRGYCRASRVNIESGVEVPESR